MAQLEQAVVPTEDSKIGVHEKRGNGAAPQGKNQKIRAGALILLLLVILGVVAALFLRKDSKEDEILIIYDPVTGNRCFLTNRELKGALDQVREANPILTGDDPFEVPVFETFGYPIRDWCVNHVFEFENLLEGLNDQGLSNGLLLSRQDGIPKWNVSHVTSLRAFLYKSTLSSVSLEQLGLLSDWDTSNVYDMSGLLAQSNTSDVSMMLRSLAGWNTSNVRTMEGIFEKLSCLSPSDTCFRDRASLQGWDTRRVTSLRRAFHYWQIGPLPTGVESTWNVERVVDMSYTFGRTANIAINVTRWKTPSLQKIWRILDGAQNVTVTGMEQWDVSALTDASYAFVNADIPNLANGLCAWGPTLAANQPDVRHMFDGTSSCPRAGTDPDWTASPPGPFCTDCL